MAILLIGSTGSGKSTLGNFLLNPDGEQVFQMARDNKPQTQFVKPAVNNVSVKGAGRVDLTVIDTPGLNESAAKDLGHMIEIIKSLKGFVHVRACIVVVKFNTKIDAQYKATVQYYSKLLPSLFAKNVTIVMTNYAIDSRSEAVRARQGIDVQQIKENTIKEIVACAGLGYDPFLFTIDCLPFDEEEKAINGQVREALLQYIYSHSPIKVTSLNVAKTEHIQRADNESIRKCDGEITGYNLRMQEAHLAAKEALKEYERKEAEVTKITQMIAQLSRFHLTLNCNRIVRIKYATDIQLLKHKITTQRQELKALKKQQECVHSKYTEYQECVRVLRKCIDKRRENIKDLSREYMTADEAIERLKALI